MSENYKFVQNTKCEYFPCHNVKDKSKFNCLFCFCPLYMLGENCGGNFKYTNGIKDCSDCMIPHSEGGYDYIMSKMGEVIEKASERE
ncbi:Cysteine-rich small domain-containing protein [Caminicella sporogenes DSM 14501]|uniref:Cysteine-rich small domain-containing protein n=1 Tax=Caminicella sporogenes DSM 14501 TaxID=1121266 RepID=A0A1M6SRA5_9FIRM|nr:cysteine-rich small domain-containing protein [Caminicella sporogenes]RKD26416.1 metal-binding protein [Caminicella sporogenes]WIF95622.1 cysteine-rich small domain-containing protein [Caminicella sporogenes]SHK47253.1 Cysteine-rich small domain-containing protein [Caminicella sporogenes DSM 14501]